MYRSKKQLVLASASPRRRELLKNLGLAFNIMPSGLAEKGIGEIKTKDPSIWTQECARKKAEEVAGRLEPDKEERWYMGVDTVVVVDGEVLGKPENEKEAREWLDKISGRWHKVVSGYCLFNPSSQNVRSNAVVTEVKIKSLGQDEIKAYLATDEPYDKAGAYAAQGVGAAFIEQIKGSYTNVVGLPLCEVISDMLNLGIIETAT